MAEYNRSIPDLMAEIEQLKAERDKYKKQCECTYCAYCGFEVDLQDMEAAKEAVSAHIAECEMHPMRAVETRCIKAEAERDRLREALKEGRLSYCACEDESKCDVCRLYDSVMQE